MRRYRAKHKAQWNAYILAYNKKWRDRNRERYREWNRKDASKRRERLKKENPSLYREMTRRFNLKAKEKIKLAPLEVRMEARTKRNIYCQRWASKNKEKIKAYQRRWRKENLEKDALRSARRRARKKQAKGSHTNSQWLQRLAFWGWRCRYCGCQLTRRTAQRDHMIALNRGGPDWPANLVPACKSCNLLKRDQPFTAFLERHRSRLSVVVFPASR